MNQYISGEKSNKKSKSIKKNKRKSIFILEKNLTEECVNVVANMNNFCQNKSEKTKPDRISKDMNNQGLNNSFETC